MLTLQVMVCYCQQLQDKHNNDVNTGTGDLTFPAVLAMVTT